MWYSKTLLIGINEAKDSSKREKNLENIEMENLVMYVMRVKKRI
jgi:hypothetical protein